MERALPRGVVVRHAQPRHLGLFNDPLAQRRDLSCFSLVFRSSDPLVSPGSCLKRTADKLDRTLHAGTVLRLGAQRPVRQIRQLVQAVQAGARSVGIVFHARPTGSGMKISERKLI
jgi:hypothetical protein